MKNDQAFFTVFSEAVQAAILIYGKRTLERHLRFIETSNKQVLCGQLPGVSI